MPKYYCDYCDTFLTHDSPSVRKTHNGGRKHKENVRMYYQLWMEEQAQRLVDATAKAFAQQRMLNPSAAGAMMGMRGIPPPMLRPAVPMPFPFPAMPMVPRPGMMPPTGMIAPVGMPPQIRPPPRMPSMPVGGAGMPPSTAPPS